MLHLLVKKYLILTWNYRYLSWLTEIFVIKAVSLLWEQGQFYLNFRRMAQLPPPHIIRVKKTKNDNFLSYTCRSWRNLGWKSNKPNTSIVGCQWGIPGRVADPGWDYPDPKNRIRIRSHKKNWIRVQPDQIPALNSLCSIFHEIIVEKVKIF